jgi:hypothetical protein
MSKKLIAVAAAAALALTGLVGVAPASANYTFGVTVVGQTSSDSGATSATALDINVPSQDVLRWSETESGAASVTASVVRLTIQASTTSAAVRVTTTGGAKVLSEATYSDSTKRKTANGLSSLDVTSSSSTGLVYVFAYSTSTAVSTITVAEGSNSRVIYIDGKNAVGYIYNINFTAPATADVDDYIEFTGNVTDAFGNKVEGLTTNPLTATTFGVARDLGTGDTYGWVEDEDAAGTYTFSVATSDTAGSGVIGLTRTITKVTALGTPKDSAYFSFSTASLASQVTTLTAQVAALTADYNALAAKWNKRVASKTAPKKKVALK